MSRESFSPLPTSLISVSDADATALAESIGIETTDLFTRLDTSRGLVGAGAGLTAGHRTCGVDC